MKSIHVARRLLGLATCAAVVGLAACDQPLEPAPGGGPANPQAVVVPGGDVFEVTLCKDAPDLLGTSFPFTLSNLTAGVTAPLGTAFNLDAESCEVVATTTADLQSLTITEEPGAYVLDQIEVYRFQGATGSTTLEETLTNTNTVDVGPFGQDQGWVVVFYNSPEPVTGDDGCTPGYWRQPHHFDSYPAGFSPDTPFIGATTGFSFDPSLQGPESGNASDLTLLDALTLRGGGVNALIRHAAAAILNANAIAYAHTPSEVQDLYNVDMDKDALEDANEAGCPLN